MRAVAIIVALSVGLGACGGAGESPSAASSRRGGGWQEDLATLVDGIERIHPTAYHGISKEAFRSAVAALESKASTLTDEQITVELQRVVNLIGEGGRDGHLRVDPPVDGRFSRHLYPLRLYHFSDGLYVVDAAGEHRDAVGGKVVAIDDTPIAEVRARVKPLVPRDNEWSLLAFEPPFLVWAEVLAGLGVARSPKTATYTILKDGRELRVRPDPVDDKTFRRIMGEHRWDHLLTPPLPFRPGLAFLEKPEEVWWSSNLPGRTFYLRYQQVMARGSEMTDALDEALRGGARRVIVDLRGNPGGDNTTYVALLDRLSQPDVRRLVLITDKAVFSAAGQFVTEAQTKAKAVVVGEPAGASPNLYGDTRAVHLPNSGFVVHVPSIWWEKGGPADTRSVIEPVVRVAFSSGDYFAGRDPVLARALTV